MSAFCSRLSTGIWALALGDLCLAGAKSSARGEFPGLFTAGYAEELALSEHMLCVPESP